MKLENPVVSLELAKRLKELGVKQESLFYWADTRKSHKEYNCVKGEFIPFNEMSMEIELVMGKDNALNNSKHYNDSEPISAFTVAELGEIFCTGDELSYKFKTYRAVDSNWWIEVGYTENRRIDETQMFQAETEADARAKMMIYLIENNFIRI